MWEILTRKIPFDGLDVVSIKKLVLSSEPIKMTKIKYDYVPIIQ